MIKTSAMKNSVKFIWMAGIIWVMTTGCSKDDPSGLSGNCGNGQAWVELVSDESGKLTKASSAYSTDPTKENCQDLKSAYTVYIRALKEISKCVPSISKDAYQQSLKSAEIEIDQICQ